MLAEVHSWVEEARTIALTMFNVVESKMKADHSVVTIADEQIEQLLRDRITSTFPDHAIVGEEQGGADLDAEYVWAIDPIDGTSSFVSGLPVWGISVGLLRNGVPVLGCFHMPLINEWYEVDLEGPALFNGQPIRAAEQKIRDPESWICVPSNVHRRYQITYPGKVRVLGSVAAYIAYVARGAAVGALLGRAKIWDLAGTMAVLHRAGGEARYLNSNRPVDLAPMLRGKPTPEPILVGSARAIEVLQPMIKIR